jgi:hypothetical protein
MERLQFNSSLCLVLGVLGSVAGSVTIRTAGTGAQRRVEDRINPIRYDAARAQLPKPAVGIRVLSRKRCTSSSDRKGRRESNLGQHFCFSIAVIIHTNQYGDLRQRDKGSVPYSFDWKLYFSR